MDALGTDDESGIFWWRRLQDRADRYKKMPLHVMQLMSRIMDEGLKISWPGESRVSLPSGRSDELD